MIRELKRMVFLVPLFLFLGMALVYPAYTPSQIGILIVGLEKDGAMKAREKTLIETVIAKKREAGPVTQKVKIYSYHFDKDAERAYCEGVLRIKKSDLLFLGIVTLNKDGLPGRLLERHYGVTDPEAAATGLVANVVRHLGLAQASASPKATAAASSTPAPSPKETAAASPTPKATATPAPKATAAATPAPKATAAATPAPKATAAATPAPKATATATPAPKATAAATPAPKATATPAVKPTPKKPVKTTTASAPVVTKKGSRWCLQFGVYSRRENAEVYLKRFPDDRFQVVEEKPAGGEARYKVLFGDFATKEEALEAEKELQKRAEVLKRQAEEWEKLYEEWKSGNTPFAVPKP